MATTPSAPASERLYHLHHTFFQHPQSLATKAGNYSFAAKKVATNIHFIAARKEPSRLHATTGSAEVLADTLVGGLAPNLRYRAWRNVGEL